MKNLNKLNAKAIKKSLISCGIKVLRCKNGAGSTKSATNIVVDFKDAEKTLSFFKEFGIVNCLGNLPSIGFSKNPLSYKDFGNLYMSNNMYNELNN